MSAVFITPVHAVLDAVTGEDAKNATLWPIAIFDSPVVAPAVRLSGERAGVFLRRRGSVEASWEKTQFVNLVNPVSRLQIKRATSGDTPSGEGEGCPGAGVGGVAAGAELICTVPAVVHPIAEGGLEDAVAVGAANCGVLLPVAGVIDVSAAAKHLRTVSKDKSPFPTVYSKSLRQTLVAELEGRARKGFDEAGSQQVANHRLGFIPVSGRYYFSQAILSPMYKVRQTCRGQNYR